MNCCNRPYNPNPVMSALTQPTVFPTNQAGQRLAKLFKISLAICTTSGTLSLVFRRPGIIYVALAAFCLTIIHHIYIYYLLRKKGRTSAITDNPSAEARFACLRNPLNSRLLTVLAVLLMLGGTTTIALIAVLNWWRPYEYRSSSTYMPLISSCFAVIEAGILVAIASGCRKLERETMWQSTQAVPE